MLKKKISELDLASASLSGYIPMSNASGTATNKVTVESILSLASGGSGADTLLRSFFVPPAPSNISASAGNAQADISWSAPTVLAQTPITDYVVQYSSNLGATWTTFSDNSSISTTTTVTGLINSTSYTFRVAAVNGVGQGNYSSESNYVTPIAGDTYFANVSLLLHGDGNNNTFTDSSPLTKSITAYGNVTQSTTQSKWGGKSIYFDGNGDYLSIPNTIDANFGSENFSIEFWLYASAQTLAPIIHQTSLNDSTGWVVWNYDNVSVNNTTRKLTFMANGSSFILTTTSDAYADNTWTHIAIIKNGSTITIYSNGVSVGSGTYSTALSNASTPLQIGGIQSGTSWNGTFYFTGYLDDIRVTKGIARTNSVPSTAFPDRGLYDDPFMEKVSLLMHANGTGSSFIDSSLTPKTITAYGNTTQSASQSKFGVKAAYFDQTSNTYLSIPDSDDLDFGTGAFSVEFWFYPTAFTINGNDTSLMAKNGNDDWSSGWGFDMNASSLKFYIGPSPTDCGGNHGMSTGQWYFISAVRDGNGSCKLYINGSQVGSGATVNTNLSNSYPLIIGARQISGSYQYRLLGGYIDELRITKGVARLPSVPTTAFSDS